MRQSSRQVEVIGGGWRCPGRRRGRADWVRRGLPARPESTGETGPSEAAVVGCRTARPRERGGGGGAASGHEVRSSRSLWRALSAESCEPRAAGGSGGSWR